MASSSFFPTRANEILACDRLRAISMSLQAQEPCGPMRPPVTAGVPTVLACFPAPPSSACPRSLKVSPTDALASEWADPPSWRTDRRFDERLSGLGPVPLRHLAQPLALERPSPERTRERRRKLGPRRARLISVLEEVNHAWARCCGSMSSRTWLHREAGTASRRTTRRVVLDGAGQYGEGGGS